MLKINWEGKTLTRRYLLVLTLGLLISCASINCASATPVYYSETGHYYEAIAAPGISWIEAKRAAESRTYNGIKGHLVTLTSQGENNFILANLGGPVTLNSYWLGGYQLPGSVEPAGGWSWVTGEPWVYSNWISGEPNNQYGGDVGVHPDGWHEEALHFWLNSGKWNDFPNDVPQNGYIIEYAGCDFTTQPGIEKCFGGIGSQCEGIPLLKRLKFVPIKGTCNISGYMSVGSILHDRCCLESGCDGCDAEWRLAWDDAKTCGRYWPITFGPYYVGTDGDDTMVNVKAPSGARIGVDPLRYPDYPKICETVCPTNKCKIDTDGNTIIFTDRNRKCSQYVECE